MNQIIDCAFCDGQAKVQQAEKELNYRKEVFKVVELFYKCSNCLEEFTTTETDTVTLLQAQNQYREKHSIPFPDDIIAIREKFELSASKMSEVLGLGINGYSNYEKGEIPSPAIGNLISTAGKPEVFKTMLERAKQYFTNGAYSRILSKVECLIVEERASHPFYVKLNQFSEPNSLNGFKRPNKDKIANILILFINECQIEFNDKLKLNKLLFFSDFANYKQSGYSITGLSYRAIDYGPAPTFYNNIFTYFENENIIKSKWIKDNNGSAKETYETDLEFGVDLFSKEEIQVLKSIIEKFKEKSSWDIVDLSHKEKCWIDLHLEKGIVSYQQCAFSLEGA